MFSDDNLKLEYPVSLDTDTVVITEARNVVDSNQDKLQIKPIIALDKLKNLKKVVIKKGAIGAITIPSHVTELFIYRSFYNDPIHSKYNILDLSNITKLLIDKLGYKFYKNDPIDLSHMTKLKELQIYDAHGSKFPPCITKLITEKLIPIDLGESLPLLEELCITDCDTEVELPVFANLKKFEIFVDYHLLNSINEIDVNESIDYLMEYINDSKSLKSVSIGVFAWEYYNKYYKIPHLDYFEFIYTEADYCTDLATIRIIPSINHVTYNWNLLQYLPDAWFEIKTLGHVYDSSKIADELRTALRTNLSPHISKDTQICSDDSIVYDQKITLEP